MKNSQNKFQILTSEKIVSILAQKKRILKLSRSDFNKVKIKIIKSYLDKRSYSLVAIYSFPSKSFVGVANSDGRKKYPFLISRFLFKSPFKKFISKPYFYDENYGLFLMEFIKGRTFGEILKSGENVRSNLKKMAETLSFFQKIKTNPNSSPLKPKIDFGDFLKNIKILRKRNNPRAEKISILLEKIKKGIKNKKEKVLVHGDFNPYNFIFNGNKLKIIDFEKTHLGERIIDLANFCSQIDSPDFNFLEGKGKIKNHFLEEYQKITVPLDREEKGRFKFYKLYFDLLILTHILVWNPNFPKLKEYENSIYRF